MPDSAVGLGRGVLRQALTAGRFELARHEPSALLAPFVDYHWIVRWDLRGQPPHEQTILPHPNVHLVFEASGAGIYGVDRALFVRVLTGRGVVLGVRAVRAQPAAAVRRLRGGQPEVGDAPGAAARGRFARGPW